MTLLTVALYLLCLFLGNMANMTLKQSSSFHLIPANVGESVLLECFYQDGLDALFYWHKQTLGHKPVRMSTLYKHDKIGNFHNEFKDNSRFTLATANGENHLKISDLRLSDSATYYCISSDSYQYKFVEAFTVIVKGSGRNLQALVHQPASATIQPGDSVTLNCTIHIRTCDGEPSVYWFRSSDESHLAIIYSNGVRNDQCEKKPKLQTQTCVYNFEVNVSDVGTYYCAVVSCGEILFGNGTNVDIKHEDGPLVLVYVLKGALLFTTILVVLLGFLIFKMKKKNSCQCTESQASFVAATTSNAEVYQDPDIHYAALRTIQANRSRRQRDNNQTECLYSSIRQES